MAAQNTFYDRLTRLFKSGPAIQRRVKGFDSKSFYSNQLVKGNYGYRAAAPFGFGRENSPFSVLGSYGILDRMSRYAEFGEMEYSLHPDTKIAVPGGYRTIKELSDECEKNPNHDFIVYSYDHNKKQIVPALGKQARKTCHEESYKITFDNGSHVIGSFNHRLMKRDGTYCIIKDLKPGDAMMPFYRRSVNKDRTEGKKGCYQTIYTINREDNAYGWTSEHRMLSEFVLQRKLKKNECVHHINFKPEDNRIENLKVMDKEEHGRYHSIILNGKKWSKENKEWIESFKKNHSKWMIENNPAERKDIRFWGIVEACEKHGFNLRSLCHIFDTDPNTIKRKLKKHGFNNFETFAKSYCADYNPNKNRRKARKFNMQNAYSLFNKNKDTLASYAKKLDMSPNCLLRALQRNGYDGFTSFKESYNNMKVVKVEPYGVIDMYDLTVDGYKNFATDTVISHNTPEIATAIDIYADEVVGGDDRGKCFHIYSDNSEIKKHLEELFYDILNVEFNLRAWTRNLVKYGDFFLLMEVLPDIGVVNGVPIPVNELEREEGYDIEDPYAVRFKWLTRGNKYLENWQVAHFRILGNDLFLPYGTSVLESGRRIWRQLVMLEDAMLTYRVVRSPERRVFYIDIGNMAPNDVPSYMEAAKAALNSRSQMDKEGGRENLRFNSPGILDDYYIPVRAGASNTRVETLSGGQHVTATEDVEYIQRKLFAALKVPKPYMNFDENLSAKASLAQMDIRFSRSIQTFQKIMIAELNKLAMIHLFSLGLDGADLVAFELKLSNPSSVALQQKLELWSAKFDVAGVAKETALVDEDWIQKNILEFTPDEIASINGGLREDKLKVMELEILEPVLPDPTAESKTTDAFDPSNYDGPSPEVPREPPVDPGDDDKVTLANFRSYDEEGNPYVVDLSPSSSPIKATPFLTKHRRNRVRRVGAGGRSNIAMPDLAAMLSAKNKYTKDVHGLRTESIDRAIIKKGPFEETPDYTIQLAPKLSKEMNCILEKLKASHDIKNAAKNMLTENLKNDLDEIDIELELDNDTLLVEHVFGNQDEPTNNNEGEIESIDEKTLSEVFNDDD